MKKTFVALAVAGVLSGATFAQSTVTLWGLVDAAVVSSEANGGDSVIEMKSKKDASRWGLKGSEDLGGGTSAFFDLHSRFDLSDGVGTSTLNTSRVGFASTYGTLSLGRQVEVSDDQGTDQVPGFGVGMDLGGGMSVDSGKRNNSIKYTSGSLYGVQLMAMYGFGEVAGSSTANAYSAIGVSYQQGPMNVMVSYDQVDIAATAATSAATAIAATPASWNKPITNSIAVGEPINAVNSSVTKLTAISGGYDFGPFKVKAGYNSNDFGSGDNLNVMSLSVSAPIGENAVVALDVASAKQGSAKLNGISVGGKYNLSSRTFVYGGLKSLTPKDTGRDDAGKLSEVGVGVQHSF